MNHVATCTFCGQQQELGRAIDAGWWPAYWDNDVEVSNPVCPPCAEQHCQEGDDGELTLIRPIIRDAQQRP